MSREGGGGWSEGKKDKWALNNHSMADAELSHLDLQELRGENHDHLFSGSRWRQSSTKAWKCGEKVRLYGCADEDCSPLEWRTAPTPGPSQIPESAPDREGLSTSSSGGMVVVSSRHGTVPFSFSSNICKCSRRAEFSGHNVPTEAIPRVLTCVAGMSLKGTCPFASSQAVIPRL